MRKPDFRKLPVPEFFFARTAFNLLVEQGNAPERLAAERKAAEDAAAFQRTMQRKLSECPGFSGCDAPSGPERRGTVVIQPGLAPEARAWLKRRFHLSERLELSEGDGLVFEIAARQRGHRGKARQRRKSLFAKPEQFELQLC